MNINGSITISIIIIPVEKTELQLKNNKLVNSHVVAYVKSLQRLETYDKHFLLNQCKHFFYKWLMENVFVSVETWFRGSAVAIWIFQNVIL